MAIYYYDNNIGNSTASTSVSDFLLGSTLSYHRSFVTLMGQYVPYYAKHDTLEEWEYGVGLVYNNGSQDILIRSIIYSSSNNNNKVSFSSGTKLLTSAITAERINHGGHNFSAKTATFTADTVQTIYGIDTSSGNITANLPSASGNQNLVLGFRNIAGSNNITIDPSGSETINGQSTLTFSPDEKFYSVISDGSGWYSINKDTVLTASGMPSGVAGSVQYKVSSTDFGGNSSFVWDNTNLELLIGASTSGNASIILPASSGFNNVFNLQKYNNDFIVYGTGTNQLYFDASTGRLGVNTASPSTILHIVGRCANDTMKLESTTQCATGVALTLYHSPSTGSSVGDYPATINLAGRNSNAEQINYGQIRSRILGNTAGSTSGELIFSVDYNGTPTNIVVANPKRTIVGLNSTSNETDNIVIGNFVVNSGSNSIIIGNASKVSGVNLSNNIVFANSGTLHGSNSLLGGTNSSVSGNSSMGLGSSNTVVGNNVSCVGNSSNISGTYITSVGHNNSASGTYLSLVGYNNTVSNSSNNSIVYGINNAVSVDNSIILSQNSSITGSGNNIIGNTISVNGNLNNIFGINIGSTGLNNTIFGSGNSVVGSGSFAIGSNNSINGNNSFVIGTGVSVGGDSLAIGFTNSYMLLASTGVTVNPTNGSGYFNVNGSSVGSGLFFTNNSLGINKNPSGYSLDVYGTIRSTGIFVDNLRLGTATTTNNSILVSDTSGNASWQVLSSIQSGIVTNISSGNMVAFDGSSLISATGVFYTTSGLFTGGSVSTPHIVIPTGNSPLIINNNNSTLNPAIRVKGSGSQNNLFYVDSSSNKIGINYGSPTSTVDISGSLKIFKDSLYFVEKNNDQFIVSYDIGPSTPNRLEISSSGIIISQTIIGTILPAHTFASTPTKANAALVKHLVWDTTSSENKLKYSTSIYGGFDSFTGSTDT